jgi:hypothetical protein
MPSLIGNKPNQVPSNGDLGTLAFQDANAVNITGGVITASGAFSANGGATLGDASGDALTINSSAVSIPNGLNFDSNTLVIDATNNRVGVGVASPSVALDVRQSTNADLTLQVRNTTAGYAAGVQLYGANSAGAAYNSISSTDGTTAHWQLTGAGVASTLTIKTNGSERMRITSTGDVGIGISSPVAPLTVTPAASVGNILTVAHFGQNNGVSNPTIGQGARIALSSIASTTRCAAIEAVHESGTNAHYLAFLTNASGTTPTEKMRITSAGNLGLGVTPSAWNTDHTVLQIKNGTTLSNDGGTSSLRLGANVFVNSSAENRYIATAAATRYRQNAGSHLWDTASSGTAGNQITFTQAMTLDASGRLLVGTTSASGGIAAGGLDVTDRIAVGSGSVGTPSLHCRDDSNTGIFFPTADTISFSTGGTNRMRIDSSGNLLVGTTSSSQSTIGMKVLQYAGGNGITLGHSGTGDVDFLEFYRGTDGSLTRVGNIRTNGTTTTYTTSSDYRLKEFIEPMTGALAKVSALKPVTYKWKIDGSDGQGFIAHELQAVVPDCVTGEKDAVDAEGNPQYQGIDTSFLVATLTASIQELKAIVDAQAERIAVLESK